ncbi:hypothetical protein JTB14_016842 [Gonioctena quinquepunctata]|nr:hypothetical protein JTB14_016842 [Gonioctena quinquepunctata]
MLVERDIQRDEPDDKADILVHQNIVLQSAIPKTTEDGQQQLEEAQINDQNTMLMQRDIQRDEHDNKADSEVWGPQCKGIILNQNDPTCHK